MKIKIKIVGMYHLDILGIIIKIPKLHFSFKIEKDAWTKLYNKKIQQWIKEDNKNSREAERRFLFGETISEIDLEEDSPLLTVLKGIKIKE